MGAEKKLSKTVSSYFMTKKKKEYKRSMAIKPEGGGVGKALMARLLREELFFAASLKHNEKLTLK